MIYQRNEVVGNMKLYSSNDVQYIVELFLAKHFNFSDVSLRQDSIRELEEICEPYGIEVPNIVENKWGDLKYEINR